MTHHLGRIRLFVTVLAVFVPALLTTGRVSGQWGGMQVVGKACDNCGGDVPLWSRVGQRCPHCGVVWGGERSRVVGQARAEPESPSDSTDRAGDKAEPEPVMSPHGVWKAWP